MPGAHRVVTGSFVTTEDGTGLVHIAPAFGADDMEAGRAHGLPVVNPVAAGRPVRGQRPAGRRPVLQGRRRARWSATWPTGACCSRRTGTSTATRTAGAATRRCCTTRCRPGSSAPRRSRTQLLAENEKTNWQPPTIKDGRYGEWLRNNVDWALSRTRYWGTPLPVWKCPAEHATCVGSLAELSELAGRDLSGLDPHRPYVDDVVIACPDCGAQARRVPEVIDVWYDSGSMPFAQLGAPHRNEAEFERTYPAQFICEAIDQTRGWFYSLMAVGTLVFGRSAYENVLCLGLLVDERGPQDEQAPGQRARADAADGRARRRRRPLVLRGGRARRGRPGRSGTARSRRSCARCCSPTGTPRRSWCCTPTRRPPRARPGRPSGSRRRRPPRPGRCSTGGCSASCTRWSATSPSALEAFDSATAGRRIAAFIDDLSNWYVRRSRRRFWEGPGTPDGAAAFATLYECLETLTRLMAPMTPFLTDYVWGVLRADDGAGLGAPGRPGRRRTPR